MVIGVGAIVVLVVVVLVTVTIIVAVNFIAAFTMVLTNIAAVTVAAASIVAGRLDRTSRVAVIDDGMTDAAGTFPSEISPRKLAMMNRTLLPMVMMQTTSGGAAAERDAKASASGDGGVRAIREGRAARPVRGPGSGAARDGCPATT